DSVDIGNDTLVYVDVWASWCVPCKMEMKYYPELQEAFKGQNVRFLFVSIDKDEEAWKKDVANYDFMDERNSFVLNEPDLAKVVNEFNIRSIPRYMVFKNGEAVSKD